jgi:hypothetical protein
MEDTKQYLESLSEIRSIMERSSKFLSLSGLSGIAAGVTALISGAIAHFVLGANWHFAQISSSEIGTMGSAHNDRLLQFILLAAGTVIVALSLAFIFTRRNASKKNLPLWDKTAKLVTFSLAVPLVTGGLFVLALVFKFGLFGLAAPATLIFYGLALVSASKYTVRDTQILGLAEICLGLLALVFFGYGLVFWIVGFGVFHIIYGAVLYYKYDQ